MPGSTAGMENDFRKAIAQIGAKQMWAF